MGFLQAQETVQIPLEENQWEFPARTKHEFKKVDGKKALWVNGIAFVRDLEFTDGSLEVKILATDKRSFGGLIFRKDGGFYEEVYLRLHTSKQVDALQYTPKFKRESNWQLAPRQQAQKRYL